MFRSGASNPRSQRAAMRERAALEDSQREAVGEEGRAPGTPEPPRQQTARIPVTRAARARREAQSQQAQSPLLPLPLPQPRRPRLGKRPKRTDAQMARDAACDIGLNDRNNAHPLDQTAWQR